MDPPQGSAVTDLPEQELDSWVKAPGRHDGHRAGPTPQPIG